MQVLRKRDELEGATRAAVLPQIGSVVIAKVLAATA